MNNEIGMLLFMRSMVLKQEVNNDESCFVVHLLEAAMNWEDGNLKVSCAI